MLSPAEKRLVFKHLEYVPSPLQAKMHEDTNRILLLAGGERAGKSRWGGAEMSANVIDGRLFWIVGPDYYQCRAEFDYVTADMAKLDAIVQLSRPLEGACSLTLQGGIKVETRTDDDPKKIASFPPDGVLMVEAAQQTFETFKKLNNRIAEKRGWLRATGTFESSLGWYAEMWKEMQGPNIWGGKSYSLPTWANLAIFPGGEKDPEILRLKATNTPEMFLERFGGIPCPPAGVVFREFRHTRHVVPMRFDDVKDVLQDEGGFVLPSDADVEVAIDPGYAGAYAVLFIASVRGRVFHFDEVYAKGLTAEQVIIEAMSHRESWARVIATQKKRGSAGVIDIAGRQHQGMESHEEVWENLAGLTLRSESVPIVDGINRHHTFLEDPFTSVPRLYHDPSCVKTLAEYGQYKYRDDSERRAESELPLDRANHSMKALAYWLVDHYGFVDERTPRAIKRVKNEIEQEIEAANAAAMRKTRETGWLA